MQNYVEKLVNNLVKEEGSEIDYSYHHRGISMKNFEKKFTLGEFVEVESVKLRQGILEIKLVKNIPEAQRPKIYQIESQ